MRPPTTVRTTGMSLIRIGSALWGSSPSTTKSASLAGVIDPLIPSSSDAYAPFMVQMRSAELVAADVEALVIGPVGVALVSAAIAVSTFGTLNGSMMTAPRISWTIQATLWPGELLLFVRDDADGDQSQRFQAIAGRSREYYRKKYPVVTRTTGAE